MPMHDWTRVEAGIYHDFHHEWISQIKQSLNRGLLPKDYYALAEQMAAGFGPDVLTLQEPTQEAKGSGTTATLKRAKPKTTYFAETDAIAYQRRKSSVVVRHVSGDRVVAMIEIVSPGNKNSANPFRFFVEKACELLDSGVHLLIIDPFPPGPRDPNGVHGAIWSVLEKSKFEQPANQPLTLVSYEAEGGTGGVRAYIETLAVSDPLPDMPLFLEPGAHILVPLEQTYQAAWNTVPARWQRVIQP